MTTKIMLSTDNLRKLLTEDAIAEIHGVAIEKVAEELSRKTIHRDEERVTRVIQAQIDKMLTEQNAWPSKRMSQNAAAILKQEIAKAVTEAVRDKADEIVKSVEAQVVTNIEARAHKLMSNHRDSIIKQLADMQAEFKATIDQHARAAFVSVLREVKETGL